MTSDPREELRQLTAQRSTAIARMKSAMHEINVQYDRKAVELRRKIEQLEPNEPEAEPEYSVKRAPRAQKDNVIERINAYNREHGLPLV